VATFGALNGQASFLDISWSQVQDFADSHAASRHQIQHESISCVCGSKDNLINFLFIDNIPLNSLWAFEDLSDDRTVAGIGKCR